MILSASATHALRAVAALAGRGDGEVVLGRDLARRIGIPPHYLAKVLATLARGGILAASRGVNGGYRLARPAARIRLIEIVLPFEGRRARPGCLLRPGKPCRRSSLCSAHEAWSGVSERYTAFLERTSVADIRSREGSSARRRSRSAGPRGAGSRRGSPRRPRGDD